MRSLRFLLTAAVMLVSSTAFAQYPHHHSPYHGHRSGHFDIYGRYVNDYNNFNYGGYGTATYGYGYYNRQIVPFYSQTYPVHPYNPFRPFDYGYYGW